MKRALALSFFLLSTCIYAQESFEYSLKFLPATINNPEYDNYNASMNDAGTRLCFARRKKDSPFVEICISDRGSSNDWSTPKVIYPFPKKTFVVGQNFGKSKKIEFPDYAFGGDQKAGDGNTYDLLYNWKYVDESTRKLKSNLEIKMCRMSNDGNRIFAMMGADYNNGFNIFFSLTLQPDGNWTLEKEKGISENLVVDILEVSPDGNQMVTRGGQRSTQGIYTPNKLGEWVGKEIRVNDVASFRFANDNVTIFDQFHTQVVRFYDYSGVHNGTCLNYLYTVSNAIIPDNHPFEVGTKKFIFEEGDVTWIGKDLDRGFFHTKSKPRKIGELKFEEPIEFATSAAVDKGWIREWGTAVRPKVQNTVQNNVQRPTTRTESEAPRAVRPTGKYYALIIGESNYADPDLNSLVRPAQDASKFRDILTRKYEFAREDVTLMVDATREEILGQFNRIRNTITPNDNLLIFYAGHGLWDESVKQGYWIPVDGKRNNSANWISNSDIKEQVRAIRSGHTLVISDACFSGGLFRTRSATSIRTAELDIQALYKMPSRRAMTSGTLSTVPDNSVFFEFLAKRLDENQEKFLPSTTLFDSFRRAVINNTASTVPQDGVIAETGDEGGDFIFIKRD